jgi:hypothetical protein
VEALDRLLARCRCCTECMPRASRAVSRATPPNSWCWTGRHVASGVVLKGAVPACGAARQQTYTERSVTARVAVPRAPPHVRELSAAVGVPVRDVSRFMGHANATTTEHIYTHLFDTDDHADAIAALDARGLRPFVMRRAWSERRRSSRVLSHNTNGHLAASFLVFANRPEATT